MTVTDILIPANHPAFAGHFPGMPIVPGVVLLDEVLSAIAAQRGVSCDRCSLIAVKFKAVVSPGQPLTLRLDASGSHGVRFELLSAGRPVASGAIAVAVQSGTASDR